MEIWNVFWNFLRFFIGSVRLNVLDFREYDYEFG